MTSKLKEVARAVHAALGWDGEYGDSEYSKKISDKVSRVALMAMKGPTEGMIGAHAEECAGDADEAGPEKIKIAFDAMINVALGEK